MESRIAGFWAFGFLFLVWSCLGVIVMAVENDPVFHRIEELEISSLDGTKLSGTLIVPKNMKGIFIPLHGSFVQTRDGDLDGAQLWMFPHGVPKRSLFRDLAHTLSALGIGSLRFDKRASGKSGGIYEDTDLLQLAHDANAVLKELRRRFPGIPLAIIGQSEGSLVALKAYDLGVHPDLLVLQGPLLDPIQPFLAFQKTHAAVPFLTDTTGELAKRMPYLSAFYEAAYHGDLLYKILNTEEDYYELRIGAWHHRTSLRKYRQYGWSGYDLLQQVKIPTLLIVGTEDGNVSPDTVRRVEREKVISNKFSNVEVRILPGLEHSFREIKPGETFVDAMRKPLSSIYLVAMTGYFQRHLCERHLVQ